MSVGKEGLEITGKQAFFSHFFYNLHSFNTFDIEIKYRRESTQILHLLYFIAYGGS